MFGDFFLLSVVKYIFLFLYFMEYGIFAKFKYKFKTKMRKVLFLLAMLPMVLLSACSNDDDEDSFNYPMETLYGTWEGVEIDMDGTIIDLTHGIYSKYLFSATFNSDGTYSGSGYFGNGSGTYKANGDMIYTYINRKEYLRYQVISMQGNTATLIMIMEGSDETLKVKVRKK